MNTMRTMCSLGGPCDDPFNCPANAQGACPGQVDEEIQSSVAYLCGRAEKAEQERNEAVEALRQLMVEATCPNDVESVFCVECNAVGCVVAAARAIVAKHQETTQ